MNVATIKLISFKMTTMTIRQDFVIIKSNVLITELGRYVLSCVGQKLLGTVPLVTHKMFSWHVPTVLPDQVHHLFLYIWIFVPPVHLVVALHRRTVSVVLRRLNGLLSISKNFAFCIVRVDISPAMYTDGCSQAVHVGTLSLCVRWPDWALATYCRGRNLFFSKTHACDDAETCTRFCGIEITDKKDEKFIDILADPTLYKEMHYIVWDSVNVGKKLPVPVSPLWNVTVCIKVIGGAFQRHVLKLGAVIRKYIVVCGS